MRFDRRIELFTLVDVQDGLGGHMQSERFICYRYANVEELSLESTIKIYGDAITQNVKAIILGSMEKIDKINGHPSVKGMKQISEQIKKTLDQ